MRRGRCGLALGRRVAVENEPQFVQFREEGYLRVGQQNQV